MAERIAVHEFVDGKCTHCEQDDPDRMCKYRDAPPRAVPPSGVDAYDFIRQRVAELAKEAGWPTAEEPAALVSDNLRPAVCCGLLVYGPQAACRGCPSV